MVGQKGKGAERLAAVASVIDIADKLRNVSVGAVKEKGDAVDVDLSELAKELRPWLLSAAMPCTQGEKPEKREREPQEAEAKGKKRRKARRAPRFSVKQWLQHLAAAQLDNSSEKVFEERGREEKESQPVLPAGLPTGAFPEVEPRTSFDFSSGSPMMALAGGDGQITTTAAEGPYTMMIGHIQLKRKGKAERMREKRRRKRETKSEKRYQAELHSIRQERIRSGILFEHPGWLREETSGFGNQVIPRVDPFQFRSVRQSDQHVAPRGGENPERTAVLEGRRRRKEARRERKRGAEWRAVRRVAKGTGITEQLRDAPANFSPEQVQVGEDRTIESETSRPASLAYLSAQRDSDAVGRERSGMLSTESILSQVQFDDDNLCCPGPEMVQGSEEERNVVKEIGVGEGGVEKKGGMSKPAELPVNSIDVQSQKVGGGHEWKEVKEQKVKESVAVKGDGGKRQELRPKLTKKQKMKQEKEKARAEKLKAKSLGQKHEMIPTHSSRQVFTLLPQEGDSETVLLYKEKKREYWKEVGRLARAGIPEMIQDLPVPVKPAEMEN